jgi:hypothetical protein
MFSIYVHNLPVGSDRAKKCIGQAVQKDVSDEWGKVPSSILLGFLELS